MKKITLFLFAIVISLYGIAQEKPRVAILDPTFSGVTDDGTKIAIREIISSTVVNLGTYSIVERSLLDKVMAEQKFSNSGAVDDTQATEIGKLSGASKVIVSVVTKTGNRRMLTVKMIDVKTATVERQKFKIVNESELLDIVSPVTSDVFKGAKTAIVNNSVKEETTSVSEGELRFFMPSGFQASKEKHNDNIIEVYMDKELIGGGTLSSGFDIVIKDPKPGKHRLKIMGRLAGETTFIKINTTKHTYFEFIPSRWVYLGVEMYSVRLKEMK
ncbi:MAG: hypothetical protein J6Q57_02460 [Paraprevotella sp.]|nr:hypothetical protein [Paraprevotella sp.]